MTDEQLNDLEALIRAVIQFDAAQKLPDTAAGRADKSAAELDLVIAREHLKN